MNEEQIRFTLNGEEKLITVDPSMTLLWVLRDQFGLTGTKYGCGIGYCGACTVILDGMALRACSLTIADAADSEVLTIEGLSKNGELHPIQQAFVDHDALQCGYCTPGMIMNAYGLLMNNAEPTRDEIVAGMGDNYCRCGAHIRIIDAIQDAGKVMKEKNLS